MSEQNIRVRATVDSYEQNFHLIGNAIRVLARCLVYAAAMLAVGFVAAAFVIAGALS